MVRKDFDSFRELTGGQSSEPGVPLAGAEWLLDPESLVDWTVTFFGLWYQVQAGISLEHLDERRKRETGFVDECRKLAGIVNELNRRQAYQFQLTVGDQPMMGWKLPEEHFSPEPEELPPGFLLPLMSASIHHIYKETDMPKPAHYYELRQLYVGSEDIVVPAISFAGALADNSRLSVGVGGIEVYGSTLAEIEKEVVEPASED